MSKFSYSKNGPIQGAIFLFFILMLVYSSLISHDVLLGYDDHNLIHSLKGISSIKEYMRAVFDGTVFDVQPVRDLSYGLDLWLKNAIGFPFHLSNVLLWFFICVLFERLLSLKIKNKKLIWALVFFVMFSPVSTSSVAWVSARKHLLSCFFTLLCTYLVIKKKDKLNGSATFWVSFLYVMGLFSHPINALWPVWLIAFLYTQNSWQKHKVWLSTLFIVMILGLALNYVYYSTIYVNKIGLGDKFAGHGIDLAFTTLALGRYFYLCLFPFSSLPVSHSLNSVENFIGLILLCLSMAILFFSKLKRDRVVHLCLLYFFLPLIIVSSRATNIFSSDTYLLNAAFGIYFLMAHLLDKSGQGRAPLIIFLYSAGLFIYNMNYVSSFAETSRLWNYAYEKEPNAQVTMLLAMDELKKKNYDRSYQLMDEIQKKWPDYPYVPQLMTEGIFFNEHLSNQKKIEIIEKFDKKSPATHFYLSILNARENRPVQVGVELNGVLRDPALLRTELKGREERVLAIFTYTCEYFKVQNCSSLTMSLRSQFNRPRFNESFFVGYLDYLRSKKTYDVQMKLE